MAACSSSSSSTPPPTSCRRSDRVGTYRLTWTEQSGTCGPINSSLVSLHPDDGAAGAGCTVHSAVWSEGDCKYEVALTCLVQIADPAQYGGKGTIQNDSVAVTRQQTSDGSVIDGTASVRLQGSNGFTCQSLYALDYTRQ